MQFEERTLSDLAKEIAAGDAAFRHFHGKLYSFIPPSREDVLRFLNHVKLDRDLFPNKHPAAVLIGKLSSILKLQADMVPGISEDNKLVIFSKIDKLELPDFNYLAIIAPLSKQGGSSNYSLAFESIAFVRTYLSLYLGRLVFYTWIADFDFDLEGKLGLSTPIFRMPMHADFLKIFDVALNEELSGRLQYQLPEYRGRLQRACNFVSNAMNQRSEEFKFASYWIALEILVGGKDDAIRMELAKAYGFDNKNPVDDFLLYGSIAKARHDFIHRGEFTKLLSYQERLLQLYFWDIVIFQIGLKHRGLARLLVASGLVEQEIKQEAQ